MKKMYSLKGNDNGIVFCVCVGIVVALIISAVLSIGLTSLIEKGKLDENGATGVFFVRFVSMLAAGLIGTGLSAKKLLPIIVAIAAGYLLVLVGAAILFFDGSLKGIFGGLLSVAAGAVVALVIRLKPQTTRNKLIRYKK